MAQAFEKSRQNMVDGQLLPNHITHPLVVEAMAFVPREAFVPCHLQRIAYADETLPLGQNRFLPEPLVLARLIQAADIGTDEIVLDVACGAGYSTALLGRIASTVVGIEETEEMAQLADKRVHDLDISNAIVLGQKDLTQGYPQQGPYNVIFIGGGVHNIPETLSSQLAEGGRLVTVLMSQAKPHMGHAILMTRIGNHFSMRQLFDTAMPVIPAFRKKGSFDF